MKKFILALDQGTTSSRAILFDREGRIRGMAQREFTQFYPREGWVEHDALEIWQSQAAVMGEALGKAGATPEDIAAIGITNQRETTVVWDRKTGRPVYNAIVWQCRRTADICDGLRAAGWEPYIREATGLIPDAYFSATKIRWILDNVPGARARAAMGELLFGTIDTWLLWNLTGGKVHATDYSNASRTMLYNIRSLGWDADIRGELKIPENLLPEVRASSGIFGYTAPGIFDGPDIPIAGIAGDQQAALFGQTCFEPGMAKNTYGTGCFLVMNTGDRLISSANGLLTTIAWGLDGGVSYALEGSVFIAGAVVQWLRDELGLVQTAAETEYFASQVADCGGVYIVPAFVGLGAPHWDMYARGAVLGLTRGTNRNHIIRAALESIAYQTQDVLAAIRQDSGINLSVLRVDGGASANNFLMQFQADILGVEVSRPRTVETTALGAAYLAGLAVGFWKGRDELSAEWMEDRRFSPAMREDVRDRLYAGWKKAVGRASGWEKD
ncbi:MAG: glycerol kinase GlpK [Spirochaetales bacterium]|jgi:glycerol kinase|nr:glycerol kinase GlpK [Spirochaetales bacterium]